jgi:hypothetical protein
MLTKEALEELKIYVDISQPENSIDCVDDPNVIGTVAVKVTRYGHVFHLLWTENNRAFEEVEFEAWPPPVGDPQISWW